MSKLTLKQNGKGEGGLSPSVSTNDEQVVWWIYAVNVKLLLKNMGFSPDVTIGDVSVIEAQDNLANENLTMKTRNALCHMQVVILHSKTSSFTFRVTKAISNFLF